MLHKAWDVLVHLASQVVVPSDLHPLFEVRDQVNSVTILLLTSDRGLCGAFNTNIIRHTLQFIRASDMPVTLVTAGRKGRDLMYRAQQRISADFSNLPDNPTILDVTPIAHTLIDDFLSGRADVVYLAYMDFVNTLVQRPSVTRLLPLRPLLHGLENQAMAEYLDGERSSTAMLPEYVYEPDPGTILNEILPRFTELQIYQAVLESQASEHSARMVAMRNASENAEAL